MRIQTLSVLCGTTACNARCPFCVSKMTYDGGVTPAPPDINVRNFHIACQLAERAGVTTAMLTGKGEPTIWPDQIELFLRLLSGRFPFIELQTNGIRLGHESVVYRLRDWWEKGLTTICLSAVHWEQERNNDIYSPVRREYPRLEDTVKLLHGVGFSVRINCVMIKGYVDFAGSVDRMIGFAQEHKVEQLTFTPVNAPVEDQSEAECWAAEHRLPPSILESVLHFLETGGHPLMDLAHGARVFDYQGQNVCLSNCLNHERYTDKSLMRNLIFFPDGHLRYDWEYEGAILL